MLYAYHDYYYVANTWALLMALGMVVVGLAESRVARWLAPCAALVIMIGQAYGYLLHYFPAQSPISPGGNSLTQVLRELTRPDEVIVITGQDWNSMTPYYAQRRALMLHHDTQRDELRLNAALRNLSGLKIGALVVTGERWQEKSVLIGYLTKLGMAEQPWLLWSDTWIFLPRDRREEMVQALRRQNFPEVDMAPGIELPSEPLGGRWHNITDLPFYQRRLFRNMQPLPVRVFSSFEPQQQDIDHIPSFGAHPLTKLVFRLNRGRHSLATKVWFNPGAYTVPPEQGPTDGVEIRLSLLKEGQEAVPLQSRLVDPLGRRSDRGIVPIEYEFTMEQEGEVELMFGPGPQGKDTHDWIWIRGPLQIR